MPKPITKSQLLRAERSMLADRSRRRVAFAESDDEPQSKRPKLAASVVRSLPDAQGDPVGVNFAPVSLRTAFVALSRDRRVAVCPKGYRTCRATAGVNRGSWYVEFQLLPQQPPEAHFRLGWANECAKLDMNVGADQHGYTYADSGHRVHQRIVSSYGADYGAGDVIGCLITFDTPSDVLSEAEASDGGASAGPADAVLQELAGRARAAGAPRHVEEAILLGSGPPRRPKWAVEGQSSAAAAGAGASSSSAVPSPAESAGSAGSSSSQGQGPANTKSTVNRRYWGSSVRFFKNGVDQGVAFVHLTKETRYYPSASMYGGGVVRINPGPTFTHPPPATVCPPGSYRPMCEAETQDQGDGMSIGIGVLPSVGAGGLSASQVAALRASSGPPQGPMTFQNFDAYGNLVKEQPVMGKKGRKG